ncbi:MAG TPA: hypothetical protein VNP72_08995, partial [Longimicrobium sp.]|nr:hypothetical protein [Longimicrobium sp.]
FTPAGLPGVELGASRFFHVPWPDGGPGVDEFLKPFEGITKASLDSSSVGGDEHWSPDNQLASIFARLVLPRAGAEFYAEYAREDHNWDVLDLTLQPDHEAGYTLGARKAWARGPHRLLLLRAELVNTQRSHIIITRKQPLWNVHGGTKTGHTLRGQLLGAPMGFGGGGSVVGVDLYHPAGRWTLEWTRARMGDRWDYWQTGETEPRSTDVMHTLSAGALFFRGAVDLSAGVAGTANLNRHHQSDVYNLNAFLSIRVGT